MRTLTSTIAVVAALGTAGVAGAETMTLTFAGTGPSKSIKLNYDAGRAWNQQASSFGNYISGRMMWTGAGGDVSTFCTQLKQFVNNGQTVNFTQTAVENVPDSNPGAMGAMRASMVRELYARHWSSVAGSGDSVLNSAFQLAIWEITHEKVGTTDLATAISRLNVLKGAIDVNNGHADTAAVASIANQLLASLANAGYEAFDGLIGLTDPTAQDQLIVVPLPMTLVLAGLGLAGVGVLRRRMR